MPRKAATATVDGELCLIPGCENVVKNRGLCQSCCQAAAKHVKAGKSTWEELEEWGLAKPPKPRSKFVAAFEAVAARKRDSREATPTGRHTSPAVTKRDDEPVSPGQARRRIRALLAHGGPQSIEQLVAGTGLDRATVIELVQDDPAFVCDDKGRHKLKE